MAKINMGTGDLVYMCAQKSLDLPKELKCPLLAFSLDKLGNMDLSTSPVRKANNQQRF